MAHAFDDGWRTPDDFLRHFPADELLRNLSSAPELRVALLAAATGIYEEILRRKSPALAAQDLRVALDEGMTSSSQILDVLSPEDRVRHLDPVLLWDFLAEERFWEVEEGAGEELHESCAQRMTFILTEALRERLINTRDILEGLGYEAVATALSPRELRHVVRHALMKGRDGVALTEKVLFEVVPLSRLMQAVPLEHVWREVVVERLAVPCGLTSHEREARRAPTRHPSAGRAPASAHGAEPRQAAPSSRAARRAANGVARPTAPTNRNLAAPPSEARPSPRPPSSSGSPASRRPASRRSAAGFPEDAAAEASSPPNVHPPSSALRPPGLPAGMALSDRGLPFPSVSPHDPARQTVPLQHQMAAAPAQLSALHRPHSSSPPEGADAAEERKRRRLCEHLTAIGRLPTNHEGLPVAVLRSIDAMYALLPSATDDIQRKSVIRQAFSSESYLRAALLGLIGLMDSSIDTSDPVIQDAKIDALIKILLFEEQRRKETGRFPLRGFGDPSGPPRGGMSPSALPPASAGYSPHEGFGHDAYGNESYGGEGPPSSVSQGWGGGSAAGGGGPPSSPIAGYPGAPQHPPLPDIPAEPGRQRRSVPPPLPSTFPGTHQS